MVGIGPSGKGRRDMQERNESRWLDVSFPELGHSMIAFLRNHDSPLAPAYQDAPVVADYFRRCEEDRRRRRGEYWRLFGGPGTMFPNVSPLARQPRTLAVWHPRGPHQTEVWRWYFVDADAPTEVKDFLRHYYIRYSGPSGMTEQDDMENWNYAHKASRGTIARQYPYNYEMGLGRATRAFEDHGLKLPGAISDVTQANAREREFTRDGADVNWFDEGKDTLGRRVAQIQTGIHWAEEPPSRICHMVSNVQVLRASPSGSAAPSEVAVRCRFLVYRNRVET